jgi:hypothetical protein
MCCVALQCDARLNVEQDRLLMLKAEFLSCWFTPEDTQLRQGTHTLCPATRGTQGSPRAAVHAMRECSTPRVTH